MFGNSKELKNLQNQMDALKAMVTTTNTNLRVWTEHHSSRIHALEQGEPAKELEATRKELEATKKELSYFKEATKQLAAQEKKSFVLKDKKMVQTLKAKQLGELEEALMNVPSQAQGFQGVAIVYEKKSKKITVQNFNSREEGLTLVGKAKKGDISLVF